MNAPGLIRGLHVLLSYRIKSLRNALRSLHGESRLKVGFIALTALLLWLGFYYLTRHSILWLQAQSPLVGGMVVEFVFNLFFAALGMMLFISNSIISYSTLFASPEARFLYTTPLDKRVVFLSRAADGLAFSSWSVFFLGLPFFAAFGMTQPVTAWWGPSLLLGLVFFVLLAGAGGLAVNLLIGALAPRRRGTVLIAVLVLLGLAIVAHFAINAQALDRQNLRGGRWMTQLTTRFDLLAHPLLPSRWLSRLSFAAAQAEWNVALRHLALLASTAFLALGGAYFLAILLYERAWSRVRSTSTRGASWRWLFPLLTRRRRKPSDVILAKDILVFGRDSAQYAQFAILLGLLLLYILNLRAVGYDEARPFWKGLVSTLNLFSTLMVLATLSTRFFFPLVSLEGSRFWVLGLAPLARGEILWAKFRFAFLANLLLAEGIVALSNHMLKMSVELIVVQAVAVAFGAAALAALAVGLGATFPQFGERSPSKIVSGFGGTLALILSSAYVMGVTILVGIPSFRWARGLMQHFSAAPVLLGSLALVVLLSALAIVLPLRLGERALKRAEI